MIIMPRLTSMSFGPSASIPEMLLLIDECAAMVESNLILTKIHSRVLN